MLSIRASPCVVEETQLALPVPAWDPFQVRRDPLRDPVFIRAINAAYDIGAPSNYPAAAPVTPLYASAG